MGILIMDWDAHHGQGTQREFYEDNSVLYISIHRYIHGSQWPNLRESDFDRIGAESGVGFNCNIPLNKVGMTDADYLAAWHQVVLPLAAEFQPDLVLVSAGFDPALGCPEGEQRVSPSTFAHMAHSLAGLANGRIVALLEGGYFLPSLAEGAALTLRQLLGATCPKMPKLGDEVSQEMKASIKGVQTALSPYWRCFNHLMGNPLPQTRWDGPVEEKIPPYNIMSTARPRGEEEGRKFTLQVAQLVADTPLESPPGTLAINASLAKSLQLDGDGLVVCQSPVSKVLLGESRAALVQSMEELTRMVKVNESKVLMVDCEVGGCMKEIPHLWKRIKLSREAGGDLFQLLVDGEEFLENGKEFTAMISSQLLPLGYSFDPNLVVLRMGSDPFAALPQEHFLLHQLQSLATGRLVLVIAGNADQQRRKSFAEKLLAGY